MTLVQIGMLLLLVAEKAAPAPTPPLRDVDAILDDYAKAIGGEDPWKRHKTVRSKRTLSVKGMQIRGEEERTATAAGKSLTVTTLPGMGTFRQGSDGRVVWSEDPINGLRILTGAEAEEARIEATWNADLQLKKMYKKVRTVPSPVPPPVGKRYDCVELTPKEGKPAITCFDAETHLRVLQKGTHPTPQGEVPYTVNVSDWKEVGGVKVPFVEEMTAGPVTIEAHIEEVKFDEKVPASLFAVPKAPHAEPTKP